MPKAPVGTARRSSSSCSSSKCNEYFTETFDENSGKTAAERIALKRPIEAAEDPEVLPSADQSDKRARLTAQVEAELKTQFDAGSTQFDAGSSSEDREVCDAVMTFKLGRRLNCSGQVTKQSSLAYSRRAFFS